MAHHYSSASLLSTAAQRAVDAEMSSNGVESGPVGTVLNACIATNFIPHLTNSTCQARTCFSFSNFQRPILGGGGIPTYQNLVQPSSPPAKTLDEIYKLHILQ